MHDFSNRPNSVYEKVKPLNFKYKSDSISINYKSTQFDLELDESNKFKFKFEFVIYRENGTSTTIIANNKTIEHFDIKNSLKNGGYTKYNCDGTLMVKGIYGIVEKFFDDTISTIDSETYEEKIEIRKGLIPIEKKKGVLSYYTSDGVLEKEKDFGDF